MKQRSGSAVRLVAAAAAVAVPIGAANAGFTPPNWESVKLRIDTAELTARRNIGTVEVNQAMLKDANVLGVPDADLSDDLFGALNAPPAITQGANQTGVKEVDIPQFFWPAIEAGRITLWMVITDTTDAKFAIDFISIKIKPVGGSAFEKTYGSHPTTTNNGFGLGIADGANLTGTLTPTGTGFDEFVTSKSIHATFVVPAPAAAVVFGLSGLAVAGRRRHRPGA